MLRTNSSNDEKKTAWYKSQSTFTDLLKVDDKELGLISDSSQTDEEASHSNFNP